MTARGRAAAVLLAVALGVSGCAEWEGANSLPLPGTEGSGPDSFEVRAEMPDVTNIERNQRVRVGDVTVGHITRIERQGWHALVTMRLNGDVELPENATAKVGQTSLLGTLHVELASPATEPPHGRLHDGSLIPLSRSGSYPTTEQTLGSLSLLLNGGGIGQLQDITKAFATAFRGREQELRSFITQLDIFIGKLSAQTDEIIEANTSLNDLVGQIADQKPVLDKALDIIPDALAELSRQRDNLAEAIDKLGKFSALAADVTHQTRESLVANLRNVAPVLKALADAGPDLTESLGLLSTYPWVKENLTNWFRGDYANLTAIIDLTLSRIDSAIFTGTRWEGDLTELELQWGRTIGQMPSPYTSANPLVAPYHFNQGP
ncbi:MCE family protein [Mycolicibacterium pulveris]|uniref:Mammalian cell entry protein n=1 Tax=Mycolicibacterium pulveris TaxID=36813 RepID=A0A7I7UHM5_MYCPV|nr:MCE family protein [Mycolicibacterium pulveris]MCV6978630.1 MCE family protein [Mycolicibacterium pulveris]BBY80179.1 mammalian cell entry protein [Mycolicibacterium pulveris]